MKSNAPESGFRLTERKIFCVALEQPDPGAQWKRKLADFDKYIAKIKPAGPEP